MTLAISGRPARAAALAAVAARLFLGLVVDAPTTQNGAWLSALIGGALAAPWLIVVSKFRLPGMVFFFPLGLWTLADGANVLAAVTRSAGYLALDRSASLVLLVPLGLAILWCVWRNGDAVGYAAMIWARIAPALLLGVALLQWRYFRPEWLRPLLGEGWPAIIEGCVRSAGWIVAASAVLAFPEDDGDGAAILPALLGSAIAAALMLLQFMLVPTQAGGGWLNRLDALLCNGRTPLYLQLPMIVLWFVGLFHLLACELFAASACLQRLLPKADGRLCALFAVAAALMLSRSNALPARMVAFSGWGFAAVGTATLLSLLTAKKGGGRPCADSH